MPNKPIVIFGNGPVAKAAQFYFDHDTDRKIAAFTVDGAYIDGHTFSDLPLVAFEDISKQFPPEKYDIFIALGYSNVNAPRKQKFIESKQKGYTLASYISPRATVWPTKEAIGENCFIHDHNVIQPFSVIGDNVVMWTSNVIGHNCVIGDHCFITGHAVIAGYTNIGECSFIGLNATLRDNITIGARIVIGAGAIILKNTQDEEVYACPQTPLFPLKSNELKTI